MSSGGKKTKKDTGGIERDAKNGEPLPLHPADTVPFNPLDTKNLGIAVAKALLEKKARPLGNLPSFRGAGIYAIYYRGAFSAYAPIAKANADAMNPRWPIYIGKAIPPGGRKGAFNTEASETTALATRLREHAESIQQARNLEVGDFVCRFLVVQDLWIPLAEQLLIAYFAPIWNRLIDGFGNHDPGSGRYNGLQPRWDVLHPGREWASKCKVRPETDADIIREIEQHLRNVAVPSLAVLGGDLAGK